MTAEEAWAERKVWRMSELTAIRDRTPGSRCDWFSNNNGIQSVRLIDITGRVRTWIRVNPNLGGERAGFVEVERNY